MFNLFRSRKKVVRYMLTGMLTVVALSMITYLIPGFGSNTSSTSADDSTLATVGNAKITAQDVQRSLQQYVRSGQIPAEMMEVYAPQFVDKMVLERASVYEFERLGLTVTDDEVLIGLMSQFSQFFQNGQLVSKEQFEAALAQQGITLQDTIEAMRYQLLLRKIQNTLLATIVVSPKEVQEELLRSHEKAKLAYIAFPPGKFRGEINPTATDVRAYFDARRPQFTIPEKRSFQAVVVDQDKVEASLVITDAQLRAAYSANLDNFRMGERVHPRHILIKTTDKSDAEKKQLSAKAEDILKQLKGGADFAEQAKKNSDDTGTAQNGGDLGWLVRDQTVPEFNKTVFALKPKELSGVVTTEYGYHIIQLLEKEAARVKPFEEVKAGLAAELKKEAVTEKMQTLGEQVRSALEKSPGSAAEVAKQFNVEAVTVTKAGVGEAIPTLGVSPEIDNTLATMKKNDVSQVMVLPSNRLAVVVLNDRNPARPAEFSEVESQVREQLISDRAQVLAGDRAKEAAGKLKAGADMEKLAKSMKLDVTTSNEFGRSDSVEGLGAAVQVGDAFAKPIGTIFGPITIQGRAVVCKVLDKKAADPSLLAAERGTVLEQLKHKKAVAANELFMDSVLAQLQAEGKVKVNRDAIRRMTASFRP